MLVWSLRLALGAVVFALLAMAHHIVYQSGYDAADKIWQMRLDDYNQVALEAKIKDDAKHLEVERQLQNMVTEKEADHQKQLEAKNVQIENLKRDVRNGALQLRIPVTSGCKVSDSKPNSGTGPASAPASQAAIVLPEIAESVLSLAGDIASDMRERNECIELYNAVKDRLNGQGK